MCQNNGTGKKFGIQRCPEVDSDEEAEILAEIKRDEETEEQDEARVASSFSLVNGYGSGTLAMRMMIVSVSGAIQFVNTGRFRY